MRSKLPISPDLGLAIAIAWLCVAAIATVTVGPRLGVRGWAWLGTHNILCLAGACHEVVKARRRRKNTPAKP